MTPLETARAEIRAKDAARKAIAEREARRASGVSWSGTAPSPFVEMTEAEVEEAARRMVAMDRDPDVILKRALLTAAKAGSLDAADVLKAADRGTQGWQARARDLLGPMERAA